MKRVDNEEQGVQEEIPVIYLFEVNEYQFVLDIHTNKIFSLKPGEFEILSRWFKGESLDELSGQYPVEAAEIERMKRNGLFCTQRPQSLAFGLNWEEICDDILHRRSQTILEISFNCNLRCRYCTFGGGFAGHRTLGKGWMSEELILKSVDSALKHSDKLEEISLGFYGGEPLIAFDLLKKAVRYAQENAKGKKIKFSMTTNATLINKSKARFLRDAGFSILVSLDGPKSMHDRFRIYPDGRGTYKDTIKGLKTLIDTYPPDLQAKISLNMVVPSPWWIPYLEELWEDEPWLPKNIRAQADLINPPKDMILPMPPSLQKFRQYQEKWLLSIEKGEKVENTLPTEEFDVPLAKLHHRKVFKGYRKTFFPNGCCIPGSRKIYIRVDGTYQVCERVHGVPTIGSVKEGVDLSQIKRIIEEYSRESFPDCKDCPAISLCSLCFVHAYRKGNFDIMKKRDYCSSVRQAIRHDLGHYAVISQKRPEKVDDWDKYVIS
jgi:uncharacterized protein